MRALSLCMLLARPKAMKRPVYSGWRLRGTAGGLIAGWLLVLPGALVIAVLIGLYASHAQFPPLQAAILGIKASVEVIVKRVLAKHLDKALVDTAA